MRSLAHSWHLTYCEAGMDLEGPANVAFLIHCKDGTFLGIIRDGKFVLEPEDDTAPAPPDDLSPVAVIFFDRPVRKIDDPAGQDGLVLDLVALDKHDRWR